MQAAHTKGEKQKLMRRLNVDASRGVCLEFGDPFTFKRNAMEVVAAVRTVYGDDADVSCCVTWEVEVSSHRFVAVVSGVPTVFQQTGLEGSFSLSDVLLLACKACDEINYIDGGAGEAMLDRE